jgi:hypothetical protein
MDCKAQNAILKRAKKAWFVFRWFLIGKYHCELPSDIKKHKSLWFWLNKFLWIFLATSAAYTIREFLEWL